MPGKLSWNCFDYLSAGCLYAYAQKEHWRIFSRSLLSFLGGFSLLLYLLIRMELAPSLIPQWLTYTKQTFLIFGTLWVIDLAAHNRSTILRVILEHPVLQEIGTRSYGLYLYHNVIAILFYDVFTKHQVSLFWFPFVFCLASLLLWLFSCLSWRYIEEPIYKLKQHFPYVSKMRPEKLNAS